MVARTLLSEPPMSLEPLAFDAVITAAGHAAHCYLQPRSRNEDFRLYLPAHLLTNQSFALLLIQRVTLPAGRLRYPLLQPGLEGLLPTPLLKELQRPRFPLRR